MVILNIEVQANSQPYLQDIVLDRTRLLASLPHQVGGESGLGKRLQPLRLRSTAPKAVGICFNISKTVTDIYLTQVTVQLLFKNTPTHSNQQLAVPLERFCAKLLGDCKDFDPENLSCTTSRYLLSRHVKISGTSCILLVIIVEI